MYDIDNLYKLVIKKTLCRCLKNDKKNDHTEFIKKIEESICYNKLRFKYID
jgi:hypothetical protein